MKNYISYLLFLTTFASFVILPKISNAQNGPKIVLNGKVTKSDKSKLSGVKILIKKDGSVVQTVKTSSSGKYPTLELPMGEKYAIRIEKEGYIPKEISIDAKTGYFEEESPGIIPLAIPFEMDKKDPEVDYSKIADGFLIGGLKIDSKTGGLAVDKQFGTAQKSKYKAFFKEIEDKKYEDDKRFNELLAAGDKSAVDNQFQDAINSYNEAKAIKENAQVTSKIEEANKKWEAFKANQEKKEAFNKIIADAKVALDEKDYGYAKSLYKKANNLLPEEKEPPIKIEQINTLIAQTMAQDEEYSKLVTEGDKAMLNEDYDVAIVKYEAALKIKDESHPKTELQKAKNLKAEELAQAAADKKRREEFDQLIDQGDVQLSAQQFASAIAKYNEALALKIDDPKANLKIETAEEEQTAYEKGQADLLAKEEAAQKKSQFDAFIEKGNTQLSSQAFQKAIDDYKKALDLNIDNATANAKISQAEEAKAAYEKDQADQLAGAESAEKRKQFDALIAKGNEQLSTQAFANAIAEYENALAMNVDNSTANKKIQEANTAKIAYEKDQADQLASADAAEKRKQFDGFITKGDEQLSAKVFATAIAEYEKALAMDVDNPTASKKIQEASTAKTAYEKDQADQLASVEAAKIKTKYDALIKKAGQYLDSKRYEEALTNYQEAQSILPNEMLPKEKIKEINSILNSALAADELEKKYNEAIEKADARRDAALSEKNSNKANVAKELYKIANGINSSNPYPQAQVDMLNNKLTEWADGLAEIEYQKIITKADDFFDNEALDSAKELYERAIKLKPVDPYPKSQLEKINRLRDQEIVNNTADAAYNNLIKKGDGELNAKEYENALSIFREASSEKPNESYPIQKINEITDILNNLAEEKNAYEAPDVGVYGEEITGKYTEDQVAGFLRKQRIDQQDEAAKIVTKRKQDYSKFLNDEGYHQLDRLNNNHSAYEAFKDNRQDDNIQKDKVRESNIASLGNFKSTAYDRYDANMQWQENRTVGSYTFSEARKTDYQSQHFENEKRREDYTRALDEYKASQYNIAATRQQYGLKITYDNHDDKEALLTKYKKFGDKANERRENEIIPQMENYKQKIADITLLKSQSASEVTYANYQSGKELSADRTEFASQSNLQLETNIEAFETYKENRYEQNNNRIEEEVNKTLQTHLDHEKLKIQQSTMLSDKDELRESKVEEMEKYKGTKLETDAAIAEKNADNGYNGALKYNEIKNQKPTMFSDAVVDDLSKSYPEGITEKMFQRKNSRGDVIEVTVLRVVVDGNKADEYKKVTARWGVNYFKNGGIVSQHVWDTETN